MTLIQAGDSDPRPVHFMGIAGAGMSALAELLVQRGSVVTGCDSSDEAVVSDLERLGVRVTIGHDPAHVDGARAVVVTSAVPRDHPELVACERAGIPVVRRADALGEITAGHELVAIAGTHGKTTTTVLTADALAAAGLRPTALVGGRVSAWSGNLRSGSDDLYVVEADEYDRSFLSLAPTVAVVTNVEADHLDIYRDLADIAAAFEQFVGAARTIVVCADDAGANSLNVATGAEVVRYGVAHPDARLIAESVQLSQDGSIFAVRFDGECLGDVQLRVAGMHNVRNALAAVAGGLALGTTLTAMLDGLQRFTGVERRFQRLGTARGVEVVDDYAHHPTEIRATLDAARTTFPRSRIVAAFQPHLYTRTRDFAPEFGAALAGADAVFLTEIYPAREKPIAGITSALIKSATERAGGSIRWLGDRSELAAALEQAVQPGDVVLTLGAGDITKTGAELLQRLRDQAHA
ncbi:MAG: UDP-N-acetylmuramate--L-alanine ligase [Gemmatimonadaceae bacterium]